MADEFEVSVNGDRFYIDVVHADKAMLFKEMFNLYKVVSIVNIQIESKSMILFMEFLDIWDEINHEFEVPNRESVHHVLGDKIYYKMDMLKPIEFCNLFRFVDYIHCEKLIEVMSVFLAEKLEIQHEEYCRLFKEK